MALLQIANETSQRLIQQPESGLGYQIVSVRNRAMVIFNASVAISLDELRSKQFSEEEYSLISGDPDNPVIRELDLLRVEGNVIVEFSIFNQGRSTDRFGLSFAETAVEPSERIIPQGIPHSYYRYSSYYKDRRINPRTGDFLPGTYATTYSDMHFVPSGFAAVGRYALPNPASARFVFQLVTFERPTLMGTATPNYGQAGGGVEVFFRDGAKNSPATSFRINAG